MNSSLLAITTTVLCLVASGVHAEEPVAPPPPLRPPHVLVFETYAFSGRIDGRATTVIAPALFASFALSERVSLNAGWIFAYSPSSDGLPATIQPGNPSIGATFALRDGAFKIRAGGSLSFPLTILMDPDDHESAVLRRAAALRGNSGFGLVAPGLLSFVPWVDGGWRQGLFRFGVEARTPLSLQLSPRLQRRADAVVQLSGYVAVDALPNLLVGTNLQAIYVTTAPAGADPTNLAVIPYVRVHGSAGFVEARLTLNLDKPLGFAFDRNGLWALGLSLGTTF